MNKSIRSILLAAALVFGNAANAFTLVLDSASYTTNLNEVAQSHLGSSATIDFEFTDNAGDVVMDLIITNTTTSPTSSLIAVAFDVPDRLMDDLSKIPTEGQRLNIVGTDVSSSPGSNGTGDSSTHNFDLGFFVDFPNVGLSQGESDTFQAVLDTTLNANQLSQEFYNGFSAYNPSSTSIEPGEGALGYTAGFTTSTAPEILYGGTVVPEPSTIALFGAACFMLGIVGVRSHNKKR